MQIHLRPYKFYVAIIFYSMSLLMIKSEVVAQSLKCFILTPPEQVLDGTKQIAVADFIVSSSYLTDERPRKKSDFEKVLNTIEKVSSAGKKSENQYFADSGKKLADLIIAHMLEADRGVKDVGSGFLGLKRKEGRSFQEGARTNVFVVVERSRLDQVLEEMKLGQTGLVDEAQAAQVGKMLGVDAIITGQLNAVCQDKWVKETRTRKKEKYEVQCNARTAAVSAAIRIINVETGELIGTREANSKQEVKKCEDDYAKDLPPAEETIDLCLQAVANELVSYFMPRFVMQKFDFDDIEGKRYKRYVELAEKNIENYDLDNAYLQYLAVSDADPYNYAALYNLGVLHEVVGNYDQALEKYTMATKLVSKETKYFKAKQRVDKQLRYWQQLTALGLSLHEHDFSAMKEQLQEATIAKVQMKGDVGDRYKVYAEPDGKSQVVIKVPGGVELEMTGKEGDWFKVKLLDGREGFVSKEDAKKL